MKRFNDIFALAILLLLLPLLLPLLIIVGLLILLWHLVLSLVLRVWFWRAHAIRDRPLMFVYSESPNWQTYIEANILPRISSRAVVLNWSQRRLWSAQSPWEERYFYHFAGDHPFNPLALVFRPNGRIRVIRFHKAFIDYKHGKAAALRAAEAELFSLMDVAS